MGACYFNQNSLKESIINLKNGLNTYNRIQEDSLSDSDYIYIHSSIFLLSNCFRIKGHYGVALSYLNEIEKEIENNRYKDSRYFNELLSELYRWKAIVCFDDGQFEQSIIYNLKAIKIAEKGGYSKCFVHENFSQLGRIFMYDEDYMKSEQYYMKAANIIKDCYGDNSTMYIEHLTDLGLLYLESEKFCQGS